MANEKTVFQRLGTFFNNRNNQPTEPSKKISSYSIDGSNVIFQTKNKSEYERKMKELSQEKLLSMQWVRAGLDNSQETLNAKTQMQMLFRDCDLMDGWPEIGAALDIYAEEACTIGEDGKMLNINSSSDRVKSVLEDLFVNRLNIDIMLPMIARGMCKYGNNYMLMNLSASNGVIGWRQLPTYEMERIENGMTNPYVASVSAGNFKGNPEDVHFVWMGHNENLPYKNWQVSHFRLLTDSFFLPYGMSVLHKARRAWKMLSMMEDMMLVYRLERSIERRVFKIFVGSIDDKDVPAYVQQIANNFKRTPIVDPMTGQIDLRKNFLDVSSDYFIPVRTENAPTPIESLPSAQNLTSMDDINYMEGKVLAALRVPKTFLNFQESQGKGQNLAITDVRFARMINRVQQALLMELNKVAIIHLYLLGFTDELTNFTLSMNSPSTQKESMELDNLQKRVQVAQSVLQDSGNGIQLYSLHKALKDIMGMSDKEISDNLNEIRLEKSLVAELEKTSQIIKRTGIFDPTDKIYGEPGAEYSENPEGEDGGMGGPMGGGGGSFGGPIGGGPDLGGDDFGSELDSLGEPGADDTGTISGNEGSTDMGGAPSADEDKIPMESRRYKKPLILEEKSIFSKYAEKVLNEQTPKETVLKRTDIYDKNFFINEEMNSLIDELDKFDLSEEVEKDEDDENIAISLNE